MTWLAAVTVGNGGWNRWFEKPDRSLVRICLGLNDAPGGSATDIPRR